MNENFKAALKFVEHFGNELERYRVQYLFYGIRNDEIPLHYLRELQNEDGGFPFNLEKGKESSVSETCGVLAILEELNLNASDVCKKTISYLFKVQEEDGSWDENIEIKKYNPPFWDMPGDLKTKMWLTGEITRLLIKLNYKDARPVEKALDFLLKHRDKEGKFAGFRISTWIAIAIFGQLKGLNNELVDKALSVVGNWIDDESDASFLVWYLECLGQGDIPKNHPIIRKCLNKLIKQQHKNGRWTSEDGERYTVSTTISTLKTLRNFDLF